jgi:hypothetical protein
MSAVDLLEAINGGDVRVIQRSEEVCVTLKPGNSVRIVDEAVRDHLEGDVTIESRITRSVHLAHPAGRWRRRSRTGRVECQRSGPKGSR